MFANNKVFLATAHPPRTPTGENDSPRRYPITDSPRGRRRIVSRTFSESLRELG